MKKEELEVNIAALELLVNEAADKSTDFKAQLAQAKQELADINKPGLTPSQLDDIYEAVEKGVSNFDFTNKTDLVEMIVEKVSKLFVEADCPEDDPTADQINNANNAQINI